MPKTKVFSLILLTSMLLLATITLCDVNVQAQSQATVTILDAVGGTTDPSAGTYSYNDGTSVTISATSDQAIAAAFSYWLVSTSDGSSTVLDNPLTFPVTGGSTYAIQPVFQVITPLGIINLIQDRTNAAIVVLLSAAGGTTVPAPGAYAFTNATAFNITAMPVNGWTFSHWVITGSDVTTGHGSIPTNLEPTDNPYNVNHGYGNTYYYQPVFTQASNPTPSPTIPEVSAIGFLLLLIAVVPVVLLARKNRANQSLRS